MTKKKYSSQACNFLRETRESRCLSGTPDRVAKKESKKKGGVLKGPVARRLVCKLADIVVRYVAARYTYARSRSRTRRYTYISRVKGKNRKGWMVGGREKGESIQRMQIRQLKRSA